MRLLTLGECDSAATVRCILDALHASAAGPLTAVLTDNGSATCSAAWQWASHQRTTAVCPVHLWPGGYQAGRQRPPVTGIDRVRTEAKQALPRLAEADRVRAMATYPPNWRAFAA